jgi:hypothetical protein
MAYLDVGEYSVNHENLLRKMIRVISGAMQGKTNNVGTVTLTANSTTTTITLSAGRLGSDTHISFTATTANAATADGAGLYVSKNVANNQFTITHNNTADVDKTFTYALIG